LKEGKEEDEDYLLEENDEKGMEEEMEGMKECGLHTPRTRRLRCHTRSAAMPEAEVSVGLEHDMYGAAGCACSPSP